MNRYIALALLLHFQSFIYCQLDSNNLKIITVENINNKKDTFGLTNKNTELNLDKEEYIDWEEQKERVLMLKIATIGDRICYNYEWTEEESCAEGFFGFEPYKKEIIHREKIVCYIERIEGRKVQIRVADIEKSKKDQISLPEYKGVKLSEGSLHWINPYVDLHWKICL